MINKFETVLQNTRELSLKSSCNETVPITILLASPFILDCQVVLDFAMVCIVSFLGLPTNDSPLLS